MGRRRDTSFKLSDAASANTGQNIIKVRCPYHKRVRFYLPEDLRIAFGDIEVDDLIYKLACRDCGCTLDVRMDMPSAEQRREMIMRRLVLRWRDVKGG